MAAFPARGETWRWPLDLADRQLTGTFMEARSGRFHSGLDLRTQGRVGVPVRAPAAGHVFRLRASAEGYGKALYLRTADGRTAVFAHLLDFSDRLRPPLVEAQMRSGTYAQDLRLPGEGIVVEAGEIVALSGATGVGAPHLHFEVRDARSRPLNPLDLYELADDRPPEISGLQLRPLGPDARVAGDARARPVADGDSVRVRGRIGVSVQLRDLRPGNDFSLMPREVELWLDGEPVYRLRQERFAFSSSGQMELEFEPDPQGGRRWLRLYRRPGNRLEGRAGVALEGLFREDGRWHALEVVARDHAGNEASRRWTVRWGQHRSTPTDEAADAKAAIFLEETHVVILAAGSDAPPRWALDSAPEQPLDGWTRVEPRLWSTALGWSQLPAGSWRLVGPRGEARSLPQNLIPGGRATRLQWETPDGRLVVEAPADAAYPGGVLALEEVAPSAGLRCGSLGEAAWQVARRGWVARAPIRLVWEAKAPLPAGAGWVLFDEGEAKWLSLRRGVDGTELRAEELDAGELRLVVDEESPTIGVPRSRGRRLDGALRPRRAEERRAAPGVSRPRWPSVDIPVVDVCAGIEEAGLRGELDGRPWPVRFDPEHETVSFDFHVDPGPGDHRLELWVQDRAGNRRSADWTLRFRDSGSGP